MTKATWPAAGSVDTEIGLSKNWRVWMQRRKFSRVFKVEAIRLIKERGVSVAQAERDLGVRAGPTSEKRERIKALEREVRELRHAKAILRKASAHFAQTELDRLPLLGVDHCLTHAVLRHHLRDRQFAPNRLQRHRHLELRGKPLPLFHRYWVGPSEDRPSLTGFLRNRLKTILPQNCGGPAR